MFRDGKFVTKVNPESQPERLPLTGRSKELALLLKHVPTPTSGLNSVLISGEAGIGKTTLVKSIVPLVTESGYACFSGSCNESGNSPSLWLWRTLLFDIKRQIGAAEFLTLPADESGILSAVLHPDQARSAANGRPEVSAEDRARFQESFATLLATLLEPSPSLLVLDDIHRADAASLQFLLYLINHWQHLPITVLALMRPGEADSGIVAQLEQLALSSQSIELGGVAEAEARQIFESVSGAAFSSERRLTEITGGNPLYITELARFNLLGHEPDADQKPRRLVTLIGKRLDAVPPGSRKLLSIASVIGRDFTVTDLAAISNESLGKVTAAMDFLLQQNIATQKDSLPGNYQFSHDLFRHAAYQSLSSDEKAQTHARCAMYDYSKLLDGLPVDATVMAQHFLLSTSHVRAEHCAQGVLEAVAQLSAHHAFEQAEFLLSRLNEYLNVQGIAMMENRALLHKLLGDNLWAQGRYPESRDAYREAYRFAGKARSPVLIAEAALGIGKYSDTGALDDELERALDTGLALLPDDAHTLRCRLLARKSEAIARYADRDQVMDVIELSLQHAQHSEDKYAIVEAMVSAASAMGHPDFLARRHEIGVHMEVLAKELDSPRLVVLVQGRLMRNALEQGAANALQEALNADALLLERSRSPYQQWVASARKGMIALMKARHTEAQQLIDHTFAMGNKQQFFAAFETYAAQILQLRWEQQRLHEIPEVFMAGPEVAPRASIALAGKLWGMLHTPELRDEGCRELSSLGTAGLNALPHDDYWLVSQCMIAEAVCEAGNTAMANTLYELLMPYADQCCTIFTMLYRGSVSRYLGLLAQASGQRDTALRHFQSALLKERSMGARSYTALNLAHITAELLITGRVAEAVKTTTELDELLNQNQIPLATYLRKQLDKLTGSTGKKVTLERRRNDWLLSYDESTFELRATKGMEYLSQLLINPGREIASTTLAGAEHALHETELESVDNKTLATLRERLAGLEEALDDAHAQNDELRCEKILEEREQILRYLSSNLNNKGRPRRIDRSAERARSAVTKALRSAICTIREQHAGLAEHLSDGIYTGKYCCYRPSERSAIIWCLVEPTENKGHPQQAH